MGTKSEMVSIIEEQTSRRNVVNETPSQYHPRKPFLALLASMVMPGLGQLYNGEATKALLLFLTVGALTPLSAWVALYGPGKSMWLVILVFVLLTLSLYFYAIINAFRTAKKSGAAYILQSFNRPYIYLIVFILGYFFIYNDMAGYTRERLMESFWIPSQSMLPNVLPGNVILADKRINCLGCKYRVQRGDLAIFISPNDRTKLYIKRIIGLPGDKIEIIDTDVRVNDYSIRLATEDNNQSTDGLISFFEKGDKGSYKVVWKANTQRKHYVLTVPNGHVYTLGDNRDATRDSRFVGPIPLVDVVGKAKQVWFSFDRQKKTVRWQRIGTVVDTND
ncbi:MAG: signal peptidase I [Gammaproteobacteria bacterium]|nr:signal peptidase I [Gammaproteobacteria bacterium]